jgi:arylsulfatase A-like enzyme
MIMNGILRKLMRAARASVVFGLFFCPVVVAADERAASPNVILIMSDDQGWGDVGFNGNDRIKTPHLDQMAASGLRFDRFYTASPLCSPTRGSCLTGRYPFRYGILAAHTAGMRAGEVTIAEIAKKKGYATGFFGKWHLGWVKPDEGGPRGFFSPPSQHGFQETFATTSAVPTWDPGVTPKGWSSGGSKEGDPWKGGFPYVHNGVEAKDNISGDDSRVIMDRVIPFVQENKGKRFFAAVWFHAPHEPCVAGEEYKNLYPEAGETRKNYYGCITAMDKQIGRLRKELRDLGIEKNTVLFFCSDNGPADGLAKKGVASAGPFKGHKHTMYEGGVLVPACVEWPGTITAGGATEVRCATVDYLPTVAKLLGYESPKKDKRVIDGVDLMPIIRGEVSERGKDLFFGYRRLYQGTNGMAIISGNFKLLHEATKGGGETRLYDLSRDPGEKNDLIKEMPERAAELERKLAEIDASCLLSRDGADYPY